MPRQSVSPTWKLPRKRPEGAQLRVRRHSDTEAVASRSAHLPSIVDVQHEGRVFNAVNCQCRKRTRVSDVRAKQGGVPVMAQQIYRGTSSTQQAMPALGITDADARLNLTRFLRASFLALLCKEIRESREESCCQCPSISSADMRDSELCCCQTVTASTSVTSVSVSRATCWMRAHMPTASCRGATET